MKDNKNNSRNTKTINRNKLLKTKGSKEQLLKKLKFCSQTFDFKDEFSKTAEKNNRLKYLEDVTDLFNDKDSIETLIIPNIWPFMNMVISNIFRPLPIITKTKLDDEPNFNDDEFLIDVSWPHIQPVYELFLLLIVHLSVSNNILKQFITHKFIQAFLELFNSEEPKEREYLKNILHRIYARIVPRRKMMRKAITNTLYTLIHEDFQFNGIPELLDILAAIISGFAVPLRQEHVQFFKTAIIPLHKVQTSQKFQNELIRCSMLFISKDPNLSFSLVEGLLKYWPFANFAKETQFLQELLEVLDVCEISKLAPIIKKIMQRLIRCIASPHLQVADRAMCFFENDFFLSILKYYKEPSFQILVPVIVRLADTHWHDMLQDSLVALRNILRDIDPKVFEQSLIPNSSQFLYLLETSKQLDKKRSFAENQWKVLLKTALEKNPDFQIPTVPYLDSHLVGKNNGLNNAMAVILID